MADRPITGDTPNDPPDNEKAASDKQDGHSADSRRDGITADLMGLRSEAEKFRDRAAETKARADEVRRAYEGRVRKGVGQSFSNIYIRDGISRVSKAETKDVQQIAASQLELLTGYYDIALAQSRRSFFWALVGSGIGLGLFLLASGFVLYTQKASIGAIPAIGGAVVEVMAGVVFLLYGKTTTQLGTFHSRLEQLQRYLLANSMCEGLTGEAKDKARSDLVREIARVPLISADKSSNGTESV